MEVVIPHRSLHRREEVDGHREQRSHLVEVGGYQAVTQGTFMARKRPATRT